MITSEIEILLKAADRDLNQTGSEYGPHMLQVLALRGIGNALLVLANLQLNREKRKVEVPHE